MVATEPNGVWVDDNGRARFVSKPFMEWGGSSVSGVSQPPKSKSLLDKEIGPTYHNNCGPYSGAYRHSVGFAIFATIFTGGMYIPYVLVMALIEKSTENLA